MISDPSVELLRSSWADAVERRLADDPQGALRAAEALVAAARRRLEERTERGEEIDAEALRGVAADYQALLVRLLAV